MMNKKIIFMFAMILLVLPFVLGAVELTFPFNQEYDIKRPCFNNGSVCSSTAICAMTLSYPDGSILLDNATMTNQNSFHNVTISPSQNDQLGVYAASMYCLDESKSGQDTFQIQITGDGFEFNVFPTELSVLILGFILIFVGVIKDRLRLFKHIGSLIVMVMGVATLFPGWANFNYSNIQGLALGSASIGLGFYFLISDSFSRDDQEETYQSKNREVDDGRFHDFD